MSREIRRVPLDFDAPLGETWAGYLTPNPFSVPHCRTCDGQGWSAEYERLQALWYGNRPFRPEDNGSVAFSVDHPVVRDMARRNVEQAPDFYGGGVTAVNREAQRLADHFNNAWMHHLNADDVTALVAARRLMDLTHTWTRENGWTPKQPAPILRPADVNVWSLSGFGHDSTNAYVVILARCNRESISPYCAGCGGKGRIWSSPEQEAAYSAWECPSPPDGEGWQLWQTVSEGGPISPVFATSGDLVAHLTTAGDSWGHVWAREAAEAMVREGWAPSVVVTANGVFANGDALVELDRQDGAS